MKRIMVVFGTRPEAIKMCPLVKELKNRRNIETVLCVTGQHRQMLDQVLEAFLVKPDYDLSIMKDQQTLFDITTNILNKIKEVLEKVKPDVVLVHGDTATSTAAALTAFFAGCRVGHVEAGLRTYDKYSPFPEEINREFVSLVADFNFAPTKQSAEYLLAEGKKSSSIFITGNTAIDALSTTVRSDYRHPLLDWVGSDRLILLTAHRRENLGQPMRQIFQAILRIVDELPDVKVIYPVHLNPKIRDLAQEILSNHNRIKLVSPLEVIDFHNFIAKSYLILTDSGGVQEEAPSLGKPVLVLRNTTERPEGIEAGTLKLVGTNPESIYENAKKLLTNQAAYQAMAQAKNPYGDGHAAERIVKTILENL